MFLFGRRIPPASLRLKVVPNEAVLASNPLGLSEQTDFLYKEDEITLKVQ